MPDILGTLNIFVSLMVIRTYWARKEKYKKYTSVSYTWMTFTIAAILLAQPLIYD